MSISAFASTSVLYFIILAYKFIYVSMARLLHMLMSCLLPLSIYVCMYVCMYVCRFHGRSV